MPEAPLLPWKHKYGACHPRPGKRRSVKGADRPMEFGAGLEDTMVKRPGLSFKARACPRCGGDAYLEAAADDKEWRCLQCGRTIPGPGQLNTQLVPIRIPARTRWS